MPGGKFDRLVDKIRPGTYINFESSRNDNLDRSRKGTVLIPLINHSYGPEKEYILIESFAPESQYKKLGFSIGDQVPAMLLIREALKRAGRVLVYIPKQGAKAKVSIGTIQVEAVHGGTRGNALKVVIVANPSSGFDVTIHLGNMPVFDYTGISSVNDLIAEENGWVTFTGMGAITANAGATLAGGLDGQATNADFMKFLETSEGQLWDALAFPLGPTGETGDTVPALLDAVASKIIEIREVSGKGRIGVLSGLHADHEGIINITNGVVLADGSRITAPLATAWVAATEASSSLTEGNTHRVYPGAVEIIGYKDNDAAIEAIKAGEFFFSLNDEGEVIIEYDINSLVTLTPKKDETYKKNRTIRVFDAFAEWVKKNFPPGKFDNDSDGWEVMEGVGRSGLREFGPDGIGAIKNIDFEADFRVDRSASIGDGTYFNVGLEHKESSEKSYFTIITR